MLIVVGCGQFASFLNGAEASYLEISDSDRPSDSIRVPIDDEVLRTVVELAARSGTMRRERPGPQPEKSKPQADEDEQFEGGDIDADDFSPFGPIGD